jgi:nitrogen regulatory protein PII
LTGHDSGLTLRRRPYPHGAAHGPVGEQADKAIYARGGSVTSDGGTPVREQQLKLITVIVQRGKADASVQAALKAGAPAATIFFGRGLGIRERLGLLGLAIQPEKEIILIVVEERLLDEVLNAMIRAGKLDQHGVGFICVTAVERVMGHLGLTETAASDG